MSGHGSSGKGLPLGVRRTSYYVTARALSLYIGYDKPSYGGDFSATIRAVMADGTGISMMPQWGGEAFVRYFPDIPMVIDQIDHLIFEDGTVIQAE